MSGDIEFGKCEVCGKEAPLQRTYWYYDFACECHSPRHFEMISHCSECVPSEPATTTITLKTQILTLAAQQVEEATRQRDELLKALNQINELCSEGYEDLEPVIDACLNLSLAAIKSIEPEEYIDKSISIDEYMNLNLKLDPHEQDDEVDDTRLGLDGEETWIP